MDNQVRILRPLSLGDLLDETLALYRRNFALFAGVVAVFAVPEAAITAALSLTGPHTVVTGTGSSAVVHGDQVIGSLSVGLAGRLISIVFSALITGALARAISARYLGQPISVIGAYASLGWRTFVRLAVASVIYGILVFLGVFTLFIMSVVFFVRYLFFPQAIVLEQSGIFGAFGRSWDLTRGSFWRVFGYALVIYVIAAILQAIVAGVPGVVLAISSGQAAFIGLFTAIASILIQPFQLGALTLLYYDLRVRKEGFDLEQLALGLAR